jgi:Uma2 family endonuclease
MTDQELIAFSRRNRPYQIERNAKGELEIMSPVGMDGARWEAFAVGEVYLWAREHGGVAFSSNGGVTLPDGSMRSPDAAWVSDARWNALSDDDQASFSPLCPDFLIEILSVNDMRSRLEAKMQMWIANGAQLAWMIDPFSETVSVYRADGTVETLVKPDVVQAGEPVLGFRLKLAAMWQR